MVQRIGYWDGVSKNDWKHFRCGYGEWWSMKMDRQNKKCSCARKTGRRKNNVVTDKWEEKKLDGPLAKKELLAEGRSRRYGKWKESSRQKISDDRQLYDNWTVWRYESEGWEKGREEKAQFAVKDLSLDRTLWLICYKTQRLCVFEKILTALVNEKLSSDCLFQCISMTCSRSQNPPFSGYIYHEHNTDYK